MLELFDLTQKLTGVFGPSGRETAVSQTIQEMVRPFADGVFTDVLGNLIVRKKGNGKKIMLSAHMDTIGMVATYIEDSGFIRFGAVGGLDINQLAGTRVIFENGIPGVLSFEEKVALKDLVLNHFYIDIGVKSKEEAEKWIKPGTFAVFDGTCSLNGDTIFSRYLDNRLGCAVLVQALSMIKSTKNDLYFVFSAQEEVGLRGAQTAAYQIEADLGIAVDVTDTGDMPGVKNKMAVKLSEGPAIKITDRSVICSPEVVELLRNAAKKMDINVQNEILISGGTDTGAMQRSKSGIWAGAVSIPTRYIHSPNELASLSDAQNAARLIAYSVSR
ncbi:MAG: M20/M25/M40 family metallo-hydrolase [Clostridiales bacterium]|nr:M20/M25/M40 family metallo-hydrolase [Clostridiales bacterium]